MADNPPAAAVVSRPAVPPIRVRRNVANLLANDPIITFYDKAIGAMKAKKLADPLSWRYQGAMHDYPPPASDFPVTADNPEPSDKSFWRQCQHNSWYFLPWHRMYIHHFEKIIMTHVAQLGGPSDWALPYWNYSASAAAALLPAPFRDTASNLYIPQRSANANAGTAFADSGDTDTTQCMGSTTFSAAAPSPSFGGPSTGFNHAGGTMGLLEATPHGSMHVAVGAYMASFRTAALDPIFWLHHCNIDRLWEAWLRLGNKNPPEWVNKTDNVSFRFHDFTGAVVSMKSSDVLDTKPLPLWYVYDDDPLVSTP
jgi:tyrosinase